MLDLPDTWTIRILVGGVVAMAVSAALLTGAALFLRWHAERESLTRRRRHLNWRPTLHLFLDGKCDEKAILETIPRSHRRMYLDFLLDYLRVVKGAEARRLAGLGSHLVHLLLPDVESKDETKRALAIEKIGSFGLSRHLEIVERALGDPSGLVAMVAAHTLVVHGGPTEIAAVLLDLDRFGHWDRRHLASILHRRGSDIAAALIFIMSDPDGSAAGRLAAIETLEHMADPRAADAAVHVLDSDESQEIQAACLRVLAAVGRPVHEPIVRGYFNSRNDFLRIHATRAWSRIAGIGHYEPLVEAMADPSAWVAIRAARGLQEMRQVSVLRSIASSPHPRARLAESMLATVTG